MKYRYRHSARLPALALLGLLACLTGRVTAATATSFTSRDGGPDEQAMLARGGAGLDGLAFVRPVLSGVLYRGGFKGGDKHHTGLSTQQRTDLCEAGFSRAWYIDFGSRTDFGETRCDGNHFDYRKGRSNHPAPIMQAVHAVIEDPAAGPLLVHCMWGVHSSGAISAMALVQFCDWSEDKAKTYWNQARNHAPCGHAGCDAWIDEKFGHFKKDSALTIDASQRQRICPK
jgi:hypothetical protein